MFCISCGKEVQELLGKCKNCGRKQPKMQRTNGCIGLLKFYSKDEKGKQDKRGEK